MSASPDHYSYKHYADPNVAEGFDELRFGGPIGRYLLESQESVLLDALAPVAGKRVIDVGTGTGRAAIGLAQAGALVTGVDASAEMLIVAAARSAAAGVDVTFERGDAHAVPAADRSFDAAVCLRVLMHAIDWKTCVAELCRVSRWRIVVDFPALGSLAALESGGRRLANALGAKTEAYRVMAKHIPAFWLIVPLLFVPPIPAIGRRTYARIAGRRYCILPQMPQPQSAVGMAK